MSEQEQFHTGSSAAAMKEAATANFETMVAVTEGLDEDFEGTIPEGMQWIADKVEEMLIRCNARFEALEQRLATFESRYAEDMQAIQRMLPVLWKPEQTLRNEEKERGDGLG